MGNSTTKRQNYRLTLFYEMSNNLTPHQLSSRIPQSVGAIARYNLWNYNDLQTLEARTSLYYHSFLPTAI